MANGSPTTSVCAAGVGVSRFRHRGRSSGFPAEDRRYHLYAALSPTSPQYLNNDRHRDISIFCLVTEVAKMVLAVKASHCHAAIVFGESAQKRAQWG